MMGERFALSFFIIAPLASSSITKSVPEPGSPSTRNLQRPPLCGWSEVTSQVALTYAASVIVGLAAQAAGRPDLIRSPKRVLAHLWEDSEL